MPQIINTNIASLNAQRNLNASQRDQETSLTRLSSGLRINSAKDDAAGLAISTRFNAQISGTNVAVRNSGDAISLAQTAEGALDSINTSLQRIRELAVQSANDTNTDLDRQALQEEVDQLVAEIQSVSEKSNFNGKNLLDGSFENAQFQTGANRGDIVNVSVAKLDTETLGSAQTAGISTIASSDTAGNRQATLAQGDLVINGITVGAADSTADTSSTANVANSSISVAAAINAVSDLSGVTATVNATVVGGSTTASVTDANTTFDLNGVTINIAGSGQAENLTADLLAVANQINEVSGQTGVVASVDVANLDAGVTLTAEDGRNIDISADVSGLGVGSQAAAATYFGSVNLVSNDGTDIEITSNTGNALANAGIEVGTYQGGVASVSSDELTGTALNDGDLVINNVQIGATYDQYDNSSTANRDGSAIAIAAAINLRSDQTNVTAVANSTVVTSGDIAADTAGSVNINNTAISFASGTTGSTSEQVGLIVDAINNNTGRTGVRAELLDDNQYTLIADDGRNIEIAGNTDAGLTDGVEIGSVTLQSGDQISISTSDSANIGNSGFEVGTYGAAEAGTALKDLDVTTVNGANDAIQAIDNAINTVASQRAQLGAVQNRFESTISNLEIAGENLSAANSRIQDADFAAETAALSRSQVLQQAGISILAQANARPQQALSLLQ